MIHVTFKNLRPSALASRIVSERLQAVVQKFPKILVQKIGVVLSMENSPAQAGKDSFGVRVLFHGRKMGPIEIEKKATNLYLACSDLCEALVERLNRNGDRRRVKQRHQSRQMKRYFHNMEYA